MSLPRMRSIAAAAAELQAIDPGTAVTPHCIRRLVLGGAVPYVAAGTRRLINLDALLDYLSGERSYCAEAAEPPAQTVGGVRRIAE